ncbi:MAG: hypothetical protein AAF203_06350 [Pseudomonadota bacterium]
MKAADSSRGHSRKIAVRVLKNVSMNRNGAFLLIGTVIVIPKINAEHHRRKILTNGNLQHLWRFFPIAKHEIARTVNRIVHHERGDK